MSNPQDSEYTGPIGHEKKIHKTHFGKATKHGGGERVKVKTKDGYTFMSREQAEELGMEIMEKHNGK